MKLLRFVVLSFCCALSVGGCVFPGSSIGYLSVRGSLESASGERLSDREIQFILPATYGLDGLDLVFSKPEDFGNKNRPFRVTTNGNGEFSYDLGRHIYHLGCWFLPPLGCFPKSPPPPFLLVRVSGFLEEYYAVQTHDGKFKVFAVDGHELSLADARLAELIATSESGNEEGRRWTVGIIGLKLRTP